MCVDSSDSSSDSDSDSDPEKDNKFASALFMTVSVDFVIWNIVWDELLSKYELASKW